MSRWRSRSWCSPWRSTRLRARRCAGRSTRRSGSAPAPIDCSRGPATARAGPTAATAIATTPPPNPFGDAAGKVQYVTPQGTILSAERVRRRAARRRAGQGARRERGRQLLQRRPRAGRAPARARGRARQSRARADRAAAHRGRRRAAAAALRRDRRGRRRHPAGGRHRLGRRARGARARLALHAPHRGADRQSRPLAAARRSRARTSWRAWRAASTRRSTRSSNRPRRSGTSWPTRATSCARRSPACAPTSRCCEDADRLPEEERASLRADIIAELDELTALVGDVVELARGSKPSDVVDDVRIDQIVRALVERAERRAGDGVVFHATLQPTVVSGEPERISRAISNLLGNATKWSPPDGAIEIALADGTLSIRDHGPGFDEADLPHVFDRFYRADNARGMPGSGPRPGDRAPGGRGARRLGDRGERARRRGAAAGRVRAVGRRQRRRGPSQVAAARPAARAGARAAGIARRRDRASRRRPARHGAVGDDRVAPLVQRDQLGQQLGAVAVGVAADRVDAQVRASGGSSPLPGRRRDRQQRLVRARRADARAMVRDLVGEDGERALDEPRRAVRMRARAAVGHLRRKARESRHRRGRAGVAGRRASAARRRSRAARRRRGRTGRRSRGPGSRRCARSRAGRSSPAGARRSRARPARRRAAAGPPPRAGRRARRRPAPRCRSSRRSGRPGPARRSRRRRRAGPAAACPKASSVMPWRATAPLTVTSSEPGSSRLPSSRNQPAP